MSDSTVEAFPEGATCVPNIGRAGRVRRIRVGWGASAISAGLLVVFAIAHVPWAWRLVVFAPAALAAFGFLQVRRNTCVGRAREGVVEHDDFTTSVAPPDQLAVSRRVAATVTRDAVLVGLGAALVGAASAWLS